MFFQSLPRSDLFINNPYRGSDLFHDLSIPSEDQSCTMFFPSSQSSKIIFVETTIPPDFKSVRNITTGIKLKTNISITIPTAVKYVNHMFMDLKHSHCKLFNSNGLESFEVFDRSYASGFIVLCLDI